MIQKEVAQRICAADKKKVYFLSVKFYAEPKYYLRFQRLVSASAKNRLRRHRNHPEKSLAPIEADKFSRSSKLGFPRRKNVNQQLNEKLKMEKATLENVFTELSIDHKIRAGKLNLDQWSELAYYLSNNEKLITCN